MIPALVLTAGLATRLRPLSLVRAKAAMPVGGEPLVRRTLRHLHAAGIRDVVLNLHHLPHTITREVGDGSDLGLRVRYSWEVPILGSAGGPRQALDILGVSSSSSLLPSSFLIINGDTLTDIDVSALIAEHRRTRALVTMAVVPHPEPGKYGGVLLDDAGAVTGRGAGARSWHFIGVQVAQSVAFAALRPGEVADSLGDVYPALIAAQPGSVRAYVSGAAFLDIGTPNDYLRTSLALAARDGAEPRGARTRVDPSARVEDSVLWDDVEVGTGASLRGSVVADGARVPPRTAWTDVILRRADGPLVPGEERVGDLAVAGI